MTDVSTDNPDRAFIAAKIESAGATEGGVPIDTNPFFRALMARLTGGKPGALAMGFTIQGEAVQGNGVISGGAIASMLDCAVATVTLSALQPGQTCTTVSITVNMLAAGQAGEFRATAEVDRLGRRVSYASAKLFDARDRLIATAISSLAVIDL